MWQGKDLQCFVLVSVATKGVSGTSLGCVADKGLRDVHGCWECVMERADLNAEFAEFAENEKRVSLFSLLLIELAETRVGVLE